MPDSLPELTTNITAYEVDIRSQARARRNFMRLVTLTALVFVIMLLFGLKLQGQQDQILEQQANLVQQQDDIRAAAQRACEFRRQNTLKTNLNWARLAEIERHNRFIDNALRKERLAVYRSARLEVPTCA